MLKSRRVGAGRVGEQEQRDGADDDRTDRQPVEAVGEVDGVRLGHHHEDGEGDVGGQRQRQRGSGGS